MHVDSLRHADLNPLVTVFDCFSHCLTGLPLNVTVLSEREALFSDQYRLLWTVRSLSPLVSHQLQLHLMSDSVSCLTFRTFICKIGECNLITATLRADCVPHIDIVLAQLDELFV